MLNFATLSSLWRPAPPELPPSAALPALAAPPSPLPTIAEEKIGKPRGKPKKTSQSRAASVLEILDILGEARRPLTVSELAAVMGCCVGEASKRVSAGGKLLKKTRHGRCVFVSAAKLSMSQWCEAHERLST